MARKRADFKDNTMASRMNAGDSNDLNVALELTHGREIHPQQSIFIHARSFIHSIQWEGVFVIVLYIMSLSTNEIGRYLTYLK